MKQAFKYAIFALIATLANLLSQEMMTWFLPATWNLWGAMLMGTFVGLLVKYWLDKKYIFFFESVNLFHDGKIFILYSVMGVITTTLFWGVEWFADWWFGTKIMRYSGAILGLALGYWVKYQLDKKFVFRRENS